MVKNFVLARVSVWPLRRSAQASAPPFLTAALLLNTTSVSVNDSVAMMAPPEPVLGVGQVPVALPFDRVSPLNVTGASAPLLGSIMLKIREVLLPLKVRLAEPGPAMLRLLAMAISPLVSVTMPVTVIWMVSPATADATAARKLPLPLSASVETVSVAARLAVRPVAARQIAKTM